MPTSLIIADLHLVSNEVEKTQLFVKFCQQEATKVDQLFILGDLFNTWLGDDLSLPNYPLVISTLKELSQSVNIFVMAGNRDFLMSKNFEQASGAKIINSPFLLEDNKQKLVLTHGDELCTDDESYQQLKSILQHPITKFIFLRLPKKWRLKLGGQLRKKSTEAQQYKSRKIMDVNNESVQQLMQKYPNSDLIHGHTHRLDTHKNEDFVRYVLGDWSATQGNAIKIDKGELNRFEIS